MTPGADPAWRDVTLSFARANLLALPLTLLPILLVGVVYLALWGLPEIQPLTWALLALPVMLVGVVAHELLHALGWLACGLPWSGIRFGVKWKLLTPYAHCALPMPARHYRIAIALPAIVLGVLPGVAGIASAWPAPAVFGALFLAAAGGDVLVLWTLRGVAPTTRVADHPDAVGCRVEIEPT